MGKRVGTVDGVVVPARVIGDLIGLSDRQVRNLAQAGVIPKTEAGSYELAPTIKAYVLHLKTKKEAQSDGPVVFEEEKALHERAKRMRAELVLGEMMGTFHRAEEVKRVMEQMLATVRARLLSIPTKVAPKAIAYTDEASIQGIVEEEIFGALSELSEYAPEMFQSETMVDEAILETVEEMRKTSKKKGGGRGKD